MREDTLGGMLKDLECQYTSVKLDKTQFVYARLDGRAFHTFTALTVMENLRSGELLRNS